MEKSKFFWFLILMVAVNTYVLLLTYQRLNGGDCDPSAAATIYGIGCFGVNYWHSVLGLGISIFYVFKEKRITISLIEKWIISIIILMLVSLLATWALFLIAIAYFPITIVIIIVLSLLIRRKTKEKR